MLIVTSVARKYLRVVRVKAGELQLRRETEQALAAGGYEPCNVPPLAVAVEKFLGHFGGVSDAARAALIELKEMNMDVKNVTTAELVDFYNKHSPNNPIKKFSDRATAEKRVQAIIDAKKPKQPEAKHKPSKPSASKVVGGKFAVTVIVHKGGKSEEKQFRSFINGWEELKLPRSKLLKFRKEFWEHGKSKIEIDGASYEFRS
jgi:hypothetical protein